MTWALKIRQVYNIGINDTDFSYSCCCKIQSGRCSEAAGSDDQNTSVQEPFLALDADFF
jgi:hypothetical protein